MIELLHYECAHLRRIQASSLDVREWKTDCNWAETVRSAAGETNTLRITDNIGNLRQRAAGTSDRSHPPTQPNTNAAGTGGQRDRTGNSRNNDYDRGGGSGRNDQPFDDWRAPNNFNYVLEAGAANGDFSGPSLIRPRRAPQTQGGPCLNYALSHGRAQSHENNGPVDPSRQQRNIFQQQPRNEGPGQEGEYDPDYEGPGHNATRHCVPSLTEEQIDAYQERDLQNYTGGHAYILETRNPPMWPPTSAERFKRSTYFYNEQLKPEWAALKVVLKTRHNNHGEIEMTITGTGLPEMKGRPRNGSICILNLWWGDNGCCSGHWCTKLHVANKLDWAARIEMLKNFGIVTEPQRPWMQLCDVVTTQQVAEWHGKSGDFGEKYKSQDKKGIIALNNPKAKDRLPFPFDAVDDTGSYLYSGAQLSWPTRFRELDPGPKELVARSDRTTLQQAMPALFGGRVTGAQALQQQQQQQPSSSSWQRPADFPSGPSEQ